MEITLPHEQLLRALELTSRISSKTPTLPVLQCVKITTTEKSVTLEATNLEMSINIPLEAQIEEQGVVAVPTQTFLQSVQLIDQKEVTLRLEEAVLQIETSKSNTSIKTFAVDEFPAAKKIEGTSLTINAQSFAYGIKSVAFAASQTSIKPELGSVYVQQKKEHSLTFVATDSFRLMEKTVSQKNIVLDQSFMIPNKNASELARVCEVLSGEPKLIITDNHCAVEFENGVYISSRLVTGTFPDYEQIIPKEYAAHVTVLKEDILKAFKKTSIFLNKFRQVSVTITDKNLTIAANNNDVGHTTDTISAAVEGEEMTLSFNQQYVMDPLSHIQDDSLKLSFAGIGRAVVMQGNNDKTLRYLVMPMNK